MRYLAFATFMLLLAACSQTLTQGKSFTDPGWNGAPARSMIVEVNRAPLSERKTIENGIADALDQRGVKSLPSHTLLLPTRDYTRKERMDILADQGYETRLVITPYNRDVIQNYVPPTRPYGTIGYGSGGYTGVGFGFDFGGGYYSEEPIIRYNADLYLIKEQQKIWTGDYTTHGPSGMNYDAVGKRFAIEIIEKLAADGLI